jgi:hypothetical protein
MFAGTDSVFNTKSVSSNISYKQMQDSYCDHRNFDSVNQLLLLPLCNHSSQYIENNTWVRGNTGDIMFNTRNKSGISKHPCIFLFII